MQRELEAGRTEPAAAHIDRVQAAIADLQVDAGFVRRKLDRVNRRIASAPPAAENGTRVRDLAAAALQAFLDGHYDDTNHRLNEILGLIGP